MVTHMVTRKIKHLQKYFRDASTSRGFSAVNLPRLHHGCKNVVKIFYFTCNHCLSSTVQRVQHAETFAKHLQKCFRAVDFPWLCRRRKNIFCECFANVLFHT